MNSYLTQIRMNLRLTLRNRTALVFAYLFPLIFFTIFGAMGMGRGGGQQLVNMALGMGVIGSGLFGVGIRAVMDREQNILRRFKVAPISPGPILVSGMVTGFIHQLPLMALIIVLAHRFYGMPWPASPWSLIVLVALGYAAFSAIGSMIASVVNSMQESQLLLQVIYFAFLFLGGTTFPLAIMPNWLQMVAQFIPTTHFTTALLPILGGTETILDNLRSAAMLALTAAIGLFLGIKLFRWEKEEKLKPAAKLWLLAVLGPFLLMGAWQLRAKDNVVKARVLSREAQRNRITLIRNARVFIGDGTVLERASVLVRNGKIAEIYTGEAPDAKSLNADEVEATGKTLLPGLIDSHVHLSSPGGIYEDPVDYTKLDTALDRELAAYLYSGVTAVKSLGDPLDSILKHRATVNSGEKLGAELFTVGPWFTAKGGRRSNVGDEVPEALRAAMAEQLVRIPATAEEARQQVAKLKSQGVDGIKVIVESAGSIHLDPAILKAITDAAHAAGLTVAAHTASARDVADAIDAGVNDIEHGAVLENIPNETFIRMKAAGITYDPTLVAVEALLAQLRGKTTPLDATLVEQVAPSKLIEQTRRKLSGGGSGRIADTSLDLATPQANLAAAYKAGVMLTSGTDSGNLLLIHGPAIHRELQLWVEAGIPASSALQAATSNNARLLGAANRMGQIKKGFEASLLLVDGNPLQDISATERISAVFLKGQPVYRPDLFKQD